MVPTVRVEFTAEVPVTLAEGAAQVSPVGELLTAQAKLTWPVKPPAGVTVSVLVPLFPAVTATVPPLLNAKLGTALTVIETLVLDAILPVAASEAVTVAV